MKQEKKSPLSYVYYRLQPFYVNKKWLTLYLDELDFSTRNLRQKIKLAKKHH